MVSESEAVSQVASERFAAALADDIYMPELVLYTGDANRVYRRLEGYRLVKEALLFCFSKYSRKVTLGA